MSWLRSQSVLWLAPLALGIFAFAHWDALSAGFGADDFLWLELSQWSSVLGSLGGAWGHGEAWRPLSRASFYLDSVVFGRNPAGWHAVNLTLHAANACALFAFTRRISGDARFAALGALLFALTPSTTENSIWISGRTHTLCVLLGFGALYALDRFLLSTHARRSLWLAPVALATLGSFMAYEAAVSLLPLAAALAWYRHAAGQTLATHARLGTAVVVAIGTCALVWRASVLSSLGLYPTYGLADLASERFALHVANFLWTPLAWFLPPWWLLALAAAFRGSRVTGQRVAASVALALLCAAPFLAVDGFGLRFTYGASMGLALALAACVFAFAEPGPSAARSAPASVPIGHWVAALCAVALIASGAAGVREHAREWRDAARIETQTFETLARILGPDDAERPLIVLGPHRAVGRAFLFYNHFASALRVFVPPLQGFVATDRELFHPRAEEREREWLAAIAEASARRGHAFCPPLKEAVSARASGMELADALVDCDASVIVVARYGALAKRFEGDAAKRAVRAWRRSVERPERDPG